MDDWRERVEGIKPETKCPSCGREGFGLVFYVGVPGFAQECRECRAKGNKELEVIRMYLASETVTPDQADHYIKAISRAVRKHDISILQMEIADLENNPQRLSSDAARNILLGLKRGVHALELAGVE